MLKFDSNKLWSDRFGKYLNELNKYLRYMFNDHLLFVLIIVLGAGIFFYGDWVKTLTPSFPAVPLMVVLLTLSICISPIITLLKRPDAVYLIVKEGAMKTFFQKAKRASFFMQSYIFIFVLAALMPMYVAVTGFSYSRFFGLLLLFACIKYWNIYFGFESQKLENSDTYWLFIRIIISALLIYLLLALSFIWSAPLVLLLLLASAYFIKQKAAIKTLKWELLIDKEKERMNRFYRLVNLFTDVPHLKGSVRRRNYLDFIYRPIPYDKRKTFAYLFSRTFIRTNEYIGLYVRLTLIAFLLLVFIQGFYLNIIFSLLFLYLTGFQFIPMIKHFDMQPTLLLYPISYSQKQRSFIHFVRILLVAQAFLFSIIGIAQNDTVKGLAILMVNLAFVTIFTFLYMPYRIKKMYA